MGPYDDERKGFFDGSMGLGRLSEDDDYTRGWISGSAMHRTREEDDLKYNGDYDDEYDDEYDEDDDDYDEDDYDSEEDDDGDDF